MIILDIKNQILAETPKDPNLFIEFWMLESVKDLCKKTLSYTEVISDVTVIDQANYPLASTIANTSMVTLVDGTYAGCFVGISPIKNKVLYDRGWELRKGSASSLIYKGGKSVRLDRIPNVAGDALTFKLAIMPTKIAADLPEVIELNYIEAIQNYVKWKVYETPKYENERKAQRFKDEYENQRDELKGDTLTDHSNNYEVDFEGFTR